MVYAKSEIQSMRTSFLPQRLVDAMLQATANIAIAKTEARNSPLKKLLTDIMLVDEIRYANAFYGKDFSHKDIILALHAGENNELSNQIALFQKCSEYAERIRGIYKILPATDFLKINDALQNNNIDILETHINANLSLLVDDLWKILSNVYAPDSHVPVLLRLALMWAEFEDGGFDTEIHLFVKELLMNFALNISFEMNHLSLYTAKHLIMSTMSKETVEKYTIDFMQMLSNAAFDKTNLIIDLMACSNEIKKRLHERLPKLCLANVLNMLNEHLLINNVMAEKALEVSTKTAISYLKQLEAIGLLESHRVGRELFYINSIFVEYIEKESW